MDWSLIKLCRPLLVLPALWSCGTQVDVGRNHELGAPRTDGGMSGDAIGDTPDTELPAGDAGPQAQNPDGTVDDDDTGGDSGPYTPGAPLTCYGPAPVLTADIAAFCTNTTDDLKAIFASSFDLICNQQRLVNLTADACAYDGIDLTTHRRVLSATPLDDTTMDEFNFFAAYSVKTPVPPSAMAALVENEMQNPDFPATHVTIRNSRLYDIVPVAPSVYEYSAELANSAATVRFRARLHVVPVTDRLTVVFDYDIGGHLLITKHRFLRLMLADQSGGTRIIGIDEKTVEDGGNHLIAYRNLMDVLEQRIEKDYANAHGW